MLSKNKIKFIKSLQQKKFRNEYNVFVVEGRKGVLSLVNTEWDVLEAYCTENLANEYPEISQLNPVFVDELSLDKASGLKTNKEAIAVVRKAKHPLINWEKEVVYLDGVSDPGNMGTIIRTTEWFGIHQIVCSEDSVEFYNPKVIQSTMGAFTKKIPILLDVKDFLLQKPSDIPVFITAFDGESPNTLANLKKGVIVMGSESHGVSDKWGETVRKITIPSDPNTNAESLNVAVATSILCYQIKQD
jgi:TrmH family RNA methyltransferase